MPASNIRSVFPAIREGSGSGKSLRALGPGAAAEALALRCTRRRSVRLSHWRDAAARSCSSVCHRATSPLTFDIVLKGLTIRGSIVGTRQELAEALDFYARGLVKPTVTSARLDDINDVLDRMERGQIDGRIVIDYRNRQAAGWDQRQAS